MPAAAVFSALPAKYAASVSNCMELIPELVEVALQEEELVSGLCATLFLSELNGPSVAGILCSYAADASDDPAVGVKCTAALVRLLAAAKERGSHNFVPSLLASCMVRVSSFLLHVSLRQQHNFRHSSNSSLLFKQIGFYLLQRMLYI